MPLEWLLADALDENYFRLSFAEFERAMIRERTSAGLAAARAEGRIGGRRKKLDAGKRKEIAESVISGR